MNRSYLKQIGLTFTILFMAFSFFACTDTSGQSTQSPTATVSQTSPVEGEPTIEEPTILTWVCTSLNNDWSTKVAIHEVCKRANVELDITIKDVNVYNDFIVPLLASGSDLPDVVQMPNQDTDMNYINSGLFYDMTDLYEEHGENINKIFEEVPTLKKQLTTPEGRMFYFPSIVPAKENQQTLLLTQSYVDTLGISAPTTIDELYDMLILIREQDVNDNGDMTDEVPLFIRAGKLLPLSGFWGIDLVSGYTADDNGNLFYSYTSDRYRDFLTFFNDLYTNNLMNADFASAGFDIQNSLYSENRIGIMVQYMPLAPSQTLSFNPEWDRTTDDLLVVPLAPLKGKYSDPYYVSRSALGSSFAISAKSEKAEAAFKFMDFNMSEESYLTKWFYPDNYTLTDSGFVMAIDQKHYNDNHAEYGGNFKGIPDYEQFIPISYGKAYDALVPIIANGTRLPTILPTYMLADEIQTSKHYSSDLETYVEEMFMSFIIGRTSISDDWDDYLSTCEALHANDMLAVKQAIYDRMN